MSREILFKGKSKRDGQWVVGSYVNVGNGVHQIWVAFSKEEREMHKGMAIEGAYGYWEEIIPESLCEYTGLHDKNGKKIFEGDIVKFGDIIGIVNYSTGCYCVKTNKPDWRSRNNPAIDIILNEYPNEIEVIGTIHDNCELLTAERIGEK